ncbi:MAG: hypothetical protein WAQ08_05825 [Aquabacterium sp.]|uniref:hypothetical protein n=1 Tax=Aquabacterium sp. TaxID=1872578 RepID=UPI003BB0547F
MQEISKTLGQVTTGLQTALNLLGISRGLVEAATATGVPASALERVDTLEKAVQALAEHVATLQRDDVQDDARVETVAMAMAGQDSGFAALLERVTALEAAQKQAPTTPAKPKKAPAKKTAKASA